MDADAATSRIRACFSLADKIVTAATTAEKLATGKRLTVVASNFYGSGWFASERARLKVRERSKSPVQVMTEVFHCLESGPPNQTLHQMRPR